MKKYILVLNLIVFCSCSTSKKVSNELVEKDKSTTNLEQKIEQQKDVINLLVIDTTVNSNLLIDIIEKETTTIDTAGNIKIEKEKKTNISNQKEQKGITQNQLQDKSKSKERTDLNRKNDTYKGSSLTTSTKTKANMDWLYWIAALIITVVIIYLSRNWIWKIIKEIIWQSLRK